MRRSAESDTGRRPRLWLHLPFRAAFLAGLWWVLVEGRSGTFAYGALVALLAGIVSLHMYPPSDFHVRPGAFIAFVPRFLWDSIRGGWDAASRALRPSLPIDPCIVDHPMGRATGPVGIALAYAMSLQPGTMAGDLSPRGLRFHAIDRTARLLRAAADNERRLSRVIREQARWREASDG